MSAYANNHILYGNYGLSNKRVQINDLSFLSSSPKSLQTIARARGNGSSIVRTRNEAKTISLTGGTTYTNNTNQEDSVLYMTSQVNKIFSYDDRYLRTVPKSKITVLDNAQTTTGWVASGDAGALTVDTTDFQWEQASLKSDITVSSGSATYTKTLTTPINLSSFTNTGNFELWVDLQDTYYITSIDIRVGSSSGNYYSQNITTNYEGRVFENGANYLSVPWGNAVEGLKMTQTGTVVPSSIAYLQVKVNYSTSASNFKAKLGGFFHVQENFVRNYPCNLDGAVTFQPDWAFQTGNVKNDFSCNLLNYTGYGIATHAVKLFSQTGITTTSATQTVDLEGNLEPALNNTFTLTTTTNLTDLRFANLNTLETIKWTNTWANGDIVNFNKLTTSVTRNGANQDFVGKLPSAQVGRNRLQMSVVTGANVLINQETVNNGLSIFEDNFSKIAGYQTFLTTTAGTLTSVEVLIQWNTGATIYIVADSASTPSTVLYSQVLTGGSTQAWVSVPCNITVSNATTYGIYIVNSPTSDTTKSVTWLYNSAGGYASGVGRRGDVSGGVPWSTIGDMAFRVNIQPTPATNISWTCDYKPLFL